MYRVKSLAEMPGPPAHPEKGNLEDIQRIGDLAHFQLQIHKEFGKIVRFDLGYGNIAVSISDPKLLRQYAQIHKKPKVLYQFLEPLIGNVFIEDPDDEVRNIVKEHYNNELVRKNWDKLRAQLDDEIRALLKSRSQAGIVTLQERVNALSMKLTVTLVFGVDFDESDKLARQMHTALEQSLNVQYEKVETDEVKLGNALNYINEVVGQLMKRAQGNENTFYRVLLDKYNQNTDPEKLKNIIKLVLMGGYHTVASTVCWNLYSIAKHPDVARKVYHEIDALIRDHDLTYAKLSKLKYLAKTFKETMRLYTPGPYTAREAEEDLEIAGYKVPKGTIIYFPLLVVHRDQNNWEDPLTFNPDRKFNFQAYMPFGSSVKNCSGINIATTLVMMINAQLLRQLRFEVASGFVPQLHENFVLTSKNDMQFKLSRRDNKLGQNNTFSTNRIITVAIGAGLLSIYYATKNNKLLLLFALLLLMLKMSISASRGFTFFRGNPPLEGHGNIPASLSPSQLLESAGTFPSSADSYEGKKPSSEEISDKHIGFEKTFN